MKLPVTAAAWKFLVAALFVGFVIGYGCHSGFHKLAEPMHRHYWSPWQDTTKTVNGLGFSGVEQKRYCTNCNIAEVEFHR